MPAWKDEKVKGSNKWCASFYYNDWLGNKKRKTKRGFLRKKDAEEWERHFLSKFAKTPDIPFISLCENYFEDMENDKLKITTLTSKRERVDKNLIPYFKDKPINQLEPLDVLKWQEYIKERGKEYSEDGYSPTYLNTINNDLTSIMNYAVRFYKLPSNPCSTAGSMGKSTAGEMNIWTLDEYEHWIAFENKPATHLAFNILFWSGCREGECLALTPLDFLPDYKLRIDKNYATVKGQEYIMPPKTPESVRDIAIPKFLYDEAQEYIASLYHIEPDERIFYFTKSHLQIEMKRVTKLARSEKIRIHDLRHSHASMLIAMGFDILEVSKRLGHKSVKITWDTYSHLYPDKDNQIAYGLDEVKLNGISSNATAEKQMLELLTELKKSIPQNNNCKNDNIILYNPVTKEKEVISREQFYEDVSSTGHPTEIFVEMMDQGYYELATNAVYCFGSRGLPIKYI